MSWQKILGLTLVGVGLTLALGFTAYSFFRSRQPTAGLKVFSTPQAQVFINEELSGQTPLDRLFRPGETTVKIVPLDSARLSPYQAKIRLTSGTYTVINRDFGDSDIQSSGEITSLLKEVGSQASLSVVTSSPESATVEVDGQPQGFTPLLISPISIGDHEIAVSAPGFSPRTITAKAVAGHRLFLTVKLAGQPIPLPTPSVSTPSPQATPSGTFVTILDTPTGFLRVRTRPSSSGTEVGQVKPGSSYPLLGSETGWYMVKVELESTSSGWVSSQYARKN